MGTDRISLSLLAASVAVVIGLEAAGGLIRSSTTAPGLAVTAVVRVLDIGFILYLFLSEPGRLNAIGLTAPDILPGIKSGLAWSAAIAAAACLSGLALYLMGEDPIARVAPELPLARLDLVLHVVVGGLIGPVAEEIFFRGILYGFFRRWGVVAAFTVSLACFILAHLSGGGIGLNIIVGGLIFTAAYERTKKLLTPIIIHVSGNLCLFALALV